MAASDRYHNYASETFYYRRFCAQIRWQDILRALISTFFPRLCIYFIISLKAHSLFLFYSQYLEK